MSKKKVLFLCTHNSARSQMAEAFLNEMYGDRFEACSAGIQPSQLNPYVSSVMKEIGIDMTAHRSKSIEEFRGKTFEYVVTVCSQAQEHCPFFPGKTILHRGFPDPSAFKGNDVEKTECTRQIRDEIKAWIIETFNPATMHKKKSPVFLKVNHK